MHSPKCGFRNMAVPAMLDPGRAARLAASFVSSRLRGSILKSFQRRAAEIAQNRRENLEERVSIRYRPQTSGFFGFAGISVVGMVDYRLHAVRGESQTRYFSAWGGAMFFCSMQ